MLGHRYLRRLKTLCGGSEYDWASTFTPYNSYRFAKEKLMGVYILKRLIRPWIAIADSNNAARTCDRQ